jgi:hypothetical protein
MEHEGSVPCSKKPTTTCYFEPPKTYPHPHMDKELHFLIAPMIATSPALPNLTSLFTLIITGEE